MSYLYINEQGSVLGIEGGTFTVKYKDGMLKRIPKETLESITVFGNIQITSQCIKECLIKGIPINYFSTNGSYYGRANSTRHVNIERYKNQVHRSEDSSFSVGLSKKIIKAKINNQIVVLKRYTHNEDKCKKYIIDMNIAKNKIEKCTTIEQIMGYEGIAARNYFNGLASIINEEFKFSGRNRRPPKDRFNSMLSLGYTILMYDVYAELENHFLNPYVGFIHSDRGRHPTLSSDLMEEWRAVIVDSTVMSLIQGYEIKYSNFVKGEDGGIYLDKDGMKIFIKKLENKFRTEVKYLSYVDYKTSFRKAISLQAGQLAKSVDDNNTDVYQPIILR